MNSYTEMLPTVSMATVTSPPQCSSPAGAYEQKQEQRVARHQSLRERNNITTCRSPGRQRDTERRRHELQRRRQQEFLRHRQIRPEPNPKPVVALRSHTLRREGSPYRRSVIMADELGINWPDLTAVQQASWLKSVGCKGTEGAAAWRLANGTTLALGTDRASRRERGVQTETVGRLSCRDVSSQTQCGSVTLKESDLIQLAEYLQEALWREERLKQKLSILQHGTSTLLVTVDMLWRTGCNEELMKSQIRALESQLQVCNQKFSRDGMKKLALQMEEQKRTYEDKALAAIQKAIEEKTEAEKKVEGLEVALQIARSDSAHWKGEYQEILQSCEQLRVKQDLTMDRLNELKSLLESAGGQEAELRSQLGGLQLEGAELRSQMTHLEEDNQAKSEQVQELKEKLWLLQDLSLTGATFQSSHTRGSETMPDETEWTVVDHLCDTQHRLSVKEKECTDLQLELEALEHECHVCQHRLKQCREELKLVNPRRRQCGWCSWLGVVLLLLVLLGALVLVLLYQPLYQQQLQGLCTFLRHQMERYLQEVASPLNTKCYRPV